MASLNSVAFTGRLGKDPELAYTPKGMAVLKTSLAVTNGYGDKQKTLWLEVNVWGKRAETLSTMLHKGSHVAVAGRLEEDTWEKDGQTHRKMKVVASGVEMLDPKPSIQEQVQRQFPNAEEVPDGVPF